MSSHSHYNIHQIAKSTLLDFYSKMSPASQEIYKMSSSLYSIFSHLSCSCFNIFMQTFVLTQFIACFLPNHEVTRNLLQLFTKTSLSEILPSPSTHLSKYQSPLTGSKEIGIDWSSYRTRDLLWTAYYNCGI